MINSENILQVRDLSVVLNGHTILDKLTFDVKRDDTLAIIGPNGAGKTVLFKAILGLLPHQGQVEWHPDVKIGYVPQKLSLSRDIPLTVAEFLSFKKESTKKVAAVLAQVGLTKPRTLKTKLGALSGGELQRALIAHAVLGNPNVLLFDEPTSGVDISGEETVYALINKLQQERDLTIIFISHELEVVYKHAAHVLCLNKKMICFGPPRKVVDKESLERMYGEEIHLYTHHGHDHGHTH